MAPCKYSISSGLAASVLFMLTLSHQTQAEPQSTHEVMRTAASAIVQIHSTFSPKDKTGGKWSKGSGVFISSQGHILTAKHVVMPLASDAKPDTRDFDVDIEVYPVRGSTTSFKAQIVKTDSENDVAIIKVEGSTPWPFLNMARSVDVSMRATLFYGGFPDGVWDEATTVVTDQSQPKGAWFVRLATSPGTSGGPLLDACGRVVAIVTEGVLKTSHFRTLALPQSQFAHTVAPYSRLDSDACNRVPNAGLKTQKPPQGRVVRDPSLDCQRAGRMLCIARPDCQIIGGALRCSIRVIADAGKSNWRELRNIHVYTAWLNLSSDDILIVADAGNHKMGTASDIGGRPVFSQKLVGGTETTISFSADWVRTFPSTGVSIVINGTTGKPGGASYPVGFSTTFQDIGIKSVQ